MFADWKGLMPRPFIVAALCFLSFHAAASEILEAALKDRVLTVAGKEIALGAKDGFRTLAPHFNSASNNSGAILNISVDATALWTDLQNILAAAASCGMPRASVRAGDNLLIELSLPGADGGNGEVVALPLLSGDGDKVLTENAGEKYECNLELLQGMVAQLPRATISLAPAAGISAAKVTGVIKLLQQCRAAGIAFLPVREINAQQSGAAQKVKDSRKSGADDARRMSHGVGGS